MNAEIDRRFAELESRRMAMVDRVKALPADKQSARPSNGAFSAAELVEHFALTEEWNLSFLQKTPPSTLAGKKATPRFMYRKVVADLNNSAKMSPTLGVMTPKGPVDLEMSAKKWAKARADMKAYPGQAADPNTAFIKMLFFFGTLSASEYLTLVEAHMNYHEARFPKA